MGRCWVIIAGLARTGGPGAAHNSGTANRRVGKVAQGYRMGLGETLSIASALAWAGAVITYTHLGRTVAPARLNLIKSSLVLLMIVPTALLAHGWQVPSVPRDALLLAVASGIIGTALADTLYFRALNTLGASYMGIVGNMYSPLVILLSVLFLGERLGPMQVIGFVLVSAGVVVISRTQPMSRITARQLRLGVLWGILSMLSMAVAIIMIKRVLEEQPLMWIVTLRVCGAILGMLATWLVRPAMFRKGGAENLRQRWPLLLLAAFLGQYLSSVLWLGGYKYTSASVAAVLNETASVFIVLLAVPLLGEALTRRKVAGVVLTIAGVGCMLAG